MKVIYDRKNWNEEAVVATVGFFDGVHPGHRFLIRAMRTLAREQQLPTAIITFPKHPGVVLRPDYRPKVLNSFEEKMELLATTGIDYVIVIDFTTTLATFTAQAFITTVLVPEWKVKVLFVGYDHRFGFQRAEGFEKYLVYGQLCGMEVVSVSSFNNDQGVAVSSSMIRSLIENGEMTVVSSLLGYHYQIKGQVVNGQHVGRQLGFPTANLIVDEKFKVIPRNGLYAVRIIINEQKYYGVLYIGLRPTIEYDDSLRIEVNIFEFSKDIYDESIVVEFIDFIREDRKFDSFVELREQMKKDKAIALQLIHK